MQKTTHYIGIFCVCTLLFLCPIRLNSWGFLAHQTINENAILGLPAPLNSFYQIHAKYLSDHAIDPDKRRYTDTAEAPKHFIDAERFGILDPLQSWDSIPRKFSQAKTVFGENFIHQYGSVPWQIQKMMYALVHAFKVGDEYKILQLSAEIGHYIADAHVPLHTTENYDGQLSHQKGIHALWETRIPEVSIENYWLMPASAHYLPSPADSIFTFIAAAHQLLPQVLAAEKIISSRIPEKSRFEFLPINSANFSGKPIKKLSYKYVKGYENLMGYMVEIQMRNAIQQVANFWYTAWVLAGKPDFWLEKYQNAQNSITNEIIDLDSLETTETIPNLFPSNTENPCHH